MTTTDPTPYLTREWQSTAEIAGRAWDAEGRRGRFGAARERVLIALRRMEAEGRAERMEAERVTSRFAPVMWRRAE